MRFSNIKGYTAGAEDLLGCFGIPSARSFSLDKLLTHSQEKDLFNNLTPRSLQIVAHYGTEPPQSNFVTVTTFFNPKHPKESRGGVLGIDILRPEKGYPKLIEIEQELNKIENKNINIYDLNPIKSIISEYLSRFPLYPGSKFFETNSEYSSLKIQGSEKNRILELINCGINIKCYATLTIAKSKIGDCRLLMSDSGCLESKKEIDLLKSCVKSILAVEKVEKFYGVNIEYDDIYVLTTYSEELKLDEDCNYITNKLFNDDRSIVSVSEPTFVPVWSQSQFIYANPPEDICPNGLTIENLRDFYFEDWRKIIK